MAAQESFCLTFLVKHYRWKACIMECSRLCLIFVHIFCNLERLGMRNLNGRCLLPSAVRGQEILEGLGEGQKQLCKKTCDIGGKEGYKMTWKHVIQNDRRLVLTTQDGYSDTRPCIMKLNVSTAMLIACVLWMKICMVTSNRAKNQWLLLNFGPASKVVGSKLEELVRIYVSIASPGYACHYMGVCDDKISPEML